MATAKNKKTEETTMTSGDIAASMLEGFDGARVNPDIFFHKFEKEDGKTLNPIRGILLERRERNQLSAEGKKQFYYIIGLTAPCTLYRQVEDGDGVEAFDGMPGQFAWVDERWALKSLEGFLPNVREVEGNPAIVGVHEVVIIPTGKRKIGGGKSVWNAEVHAGPRNPSQVGVPLIAPKANQPPALPAPPSEEIPF